MLWMASAAMASISCGGGEAPYFPVEIELGNDFIGARCIEGFDSAVELGDVGFGPFKFGERWSQRFEVHDINSVMAKSDPTKNPEFQRVLGNLLKAPPKPHSEMRIGERNRSAKKAKSRAKHASRAKPKSA
jgi:hypothetical protein